MSHCSNTLPDTDYYLYILRHVLLLAAIHYDQQTITAMQPIRNPTTNMLHWNSFSILDSDGSPVAAPSRSRLLSCEIIPINPTIPRPARDLNEQITRRLNILATQKMKKHFNKQQQLPFSSRELVSAAGVYILPIWANLGRDNESCDDLGDVGKMRMGRQQSPDMETPTTARNKG